MGTAQRSPQLQLTSTATATGKYNAGFSKPFALKPTNCEVGDALKCTVQLHWKNSCTGAFVCTYELRKAICVVRKDCRHMQNDDSVKLSNETVGLKRPALGKKFPSIKPCAQKSASHKHMLSARLISYIRVGAQITCAIPALYPLLEKAIALLG